MSPAVASTGLGCAGCWRLGLVLGGGIAARGPRRGGLSSRWCLCPPFPYGCPPYPHTLRRVRRPLMPRALQGALFCKSTSLGALTPITGLTEITGPGRAAEAVMGAAGTGEPVGLSRGGGDARRAAAVVWTWPRLSCREERRGGLGGCGSVLRGDPGYMGCTGVRRVL